MKEPTGQENQGWQGRENSRVRTSVWIEPVLVFVVSFVLVLIVINLVMPEPRWDQTVSDQFTNRFQDQGMSVFQVGPAERHEALASLEGLDRQRLLREVFDLLTVQAQANSEKQSAVLSFLRSFNILDESALGDEEIIVTDPLPLLMSRQATPRQLSMFGADLFAAAGYPTRVVYTGHTWVAEVFYDDSWHFLDGSSSGLDGRTVVNEVQVIPSFEEMNELRTSLDALPHGLAPTTEGGPRPESAMSRSSLYYSLPVEKLQREDFSGPVYVEKVGIGRRGDPTFGWAHDNRDSIANIDLHGEPLIRYQPGVPKWRDIQQQDDRAHLSWEEPEDRDGDLLGYRVHVRKVPRGWNYSTFLGDASAQSFWHPTGPWAKNMRASLFQVPREPVTVLTTTKPEIEIELPPDEPVYVTIMPYDAYHEACGRELYPMSNEVRVVRGQSEN